MVQGNQWRRAFRRIDIKAFTLYNMGFKVAKINNRGLIRAFPAFRCISYGENRHKRMPIRAIFFITKRQSEDWRFVLLPITEYTFL
jgi:uncharacterized protein (DUF488 family)